MENNNNYEMINHPSHYNNYDVEVIDMIERIWGIELAQKWCEITAFKYRMRLGLKPDNPIRQDLKKEKFYLDKSKHYKCLMNKNDFKQQNVSIFSDIYAYANETEK